MRSALDSSPDERAGRERLRAVWEEGRASLRALPGRGRGPGPAVEGAGQAGGGGARAGPAEEAGGRPGRWRVGGARPAKAGRFWAVPRRARVGGRGHRRTHAGPAPRLQLQRPARSRRLGPGPALAPLRAPGRRHRHPTAPLSGPHGGAAKIPPPLGSAYTWAHSFTIIYCK